MPVCDSASAAAPQWPAQLLGLLLCVAFCAAGGGAGPSFNVSAQCGGRASKELDIVYVLPQPCRDTGGSGAGAALLGGCQRAMDTCLGEKHLGEGPSCSSSLQRCAAPFVACVHDAAVHGHGCGEWPSSAHMALIAAASGVPFAETGLLAACEALMCALASNEPACDGEALLFGVYDEVCTWARQSKSATPTPSRSHSSSRSPTTTRSGASLSASAATGTTTRTLSVSLSADSSTFTGSQSREPTLTPPLRAPVLSVAPAVVSQMAIREAPLEVVLAISGNSFPVQHADVKARVFVCITLEPVTGTPANVASMLASVLHDAFSVSSVVAVDATNATLRVPQLALLHARTTVVLNITLHPTCLNAALPPAPPDGHALSAALTIRFRPPEPLPGVPAAAQQSAEGAAFAGVLVGAAVSFSGGSASSPARLMAIASLPACYFELGEPLPWHAHPTRVAIGPDDDPARFHTGAAVMNTVLIVGITLLHLGISHFLGEVAADGGALAGGMARAHFPGLSFVPAMMLLQPTIEACLIVLVHGTNDGARAGAGIVLTLWFGLIVTIAALLTHFFRSRFHDAVDGPLLPPRYGVDYPDDEVNGDGRSGDPLLQLGDRPRQPRAMPRSSSSSSPAVLARGKRGHQRHERRRRRDSSGLMEFMCGTGRWVELLGARWRFAAMLGPLFGADRDGRHFFAFIECLFATAVAALLSVQPSTCDAILPLWVALTALYFVLVAVLRPRIAAFEKLVHVLVAALQLSSTSLSLAAAHDAERRPTLLKGASWIVVVAMYLSAASAAVSVTCAVAAWVHTRWVKRQRVRGASRGDGRRLDASESDDAGAPTRSSARGRSRGGLESNAAGSNTEGARRSHSHARRARSSSSSTSSIELLEDVRREQRRRDQHRHHQQQQRNDGGDGLEALDAPLLSVPGMAVGADALRPLRPVAVHEPRIAASSPQQLPHLQPLPETVQAIMPQPPPPPPPLQHAAPVDIDEATRAPAPSATAAPAAPAAPSAPPPEPAAQTTTPPAPAPAPVSGVSKEEVEKLLEEERARAAEMTKRILEGVRREAAEEADRRTAELAARAAELEKRVAEAAEKERLEASAREYKRKLRREKRRVLQELAESDSEPSDPEEADRAWLRQVRALEGPATRRQMLKLHGAAHLMDSASPPPSPPRSQRWRNTDPPPFTVRAALPPPYLPHPYQAAVMRPPRPADPWQHPAAASAFYGAQPSPPRWPQDVAHWSPPSEMGTAWQRRWASNPNTPSSPSPPPRRLADDEWEMLDAL